MSARRSPRLTKLSTKYNRMRKKSPAGEERGQPSSQAREVVLIDLVSSEDEDVGCGAFDVRKGGIADESHFVSGNLVESGHSREDGCRLMAFRDSDVSSFTRDLGADCQGWRRLESTHLCHHDSDDSILTEDASVMTQDLTQYHTVLEETAMEGSSSGGTFVTAPGSKIDKLENLPRLGEDSDGDGTEIPLPTTPIPTPTRKPSTMTGSVLFSIGKRKSLVPIRCNQRPILADDSSEDDFLPQKQQHPRSRRGLRKSVLGNHRVFLLPSDSDEEAPVDPRKQIVKQWVSTSPFSPPARDEPKNLSYFRLLQESQHSLGTLRLSSDSSNDDSSLTGQLEHTSLFEMRPSEERRESDCLTSTATSQFEEEEEKDATHQESRKDISLQVSLDDSAESQEVVNDRSQDLLAPLQSRQDVSLQVSLNSTRNGANSSVADSREESSDCSVESVKEVHVTSPMSSVGTRGLTFGSPLSQAKRETKPILLTGGESSEDENELGDFFRRHRVQKSNEHLTGREDKRLTLEKFIVEDSSSSSSDQSDDGQDPDPEVDRNIGSETSGESSADGGSSNRDTSDEESPERIKKGNRFGDTKPSRPMPPPSRQVLKDRNREEPPPTLSFLQSLSLEEPNSRCHPMAVKFITKFSKHKVELAEKLFRLFNEDIFHSSLDPQTRIEWAPRLTKTAGQCCQKAVIMPGSDERAREMWIRLSAKVIDSSDRLRDTLIHEMCHGASWIISGYRDGHGPIWRDWAQRAMKRYPELPVISRCHSYAIRTKYTYECTTCFYKVNRHSKSLDLSRWRCGKCKGQFQLHLNRIQGPAGLRTPAGKSQEVKAFATPRTPNAFALFVKDNYKVVRTPGVPHKDAMQELSKRFAETKLSSEIRLT